MIYIAGPFFNIEEREQLNKMIDVVRKTYPDSELFIPMKHTIEGGESMPNEEWGKRVFQMDVEAIDRCSMVVALYLGHYSDTGTAWEIGYAFAKSIPVVLYIPEEYRKNDMSIMPVNSAEMVTRKYNELNQK